MKTLLNVLYGSKLALTFEYLMYITYLQNFSKYAENDYELCNSNVLKYT